MLDELATLDLFVDFLVEHRGWHFPIFSGLCDRCGDDGVANLALAEPFPVQLQLCPPCIVHVRKEAAKEYSGYLGLAAVYALAYRNAAQDRRVRPQSRAQRGQG